MHKSKLVSFSDFGPSGQRREAEREAVSSFSAFHISLPIRYLSMSTSANASAESMMKGEPKSSKGDGNHSPDTFKLLLKKLVQTPSEFTADDCASSFRHLCAHAATDGQVSSRVYTTTADR